MKKSIAILLILAMLVSSAFVACKKKDNGEENPSGYGTSGLEDADAEIEFRDIEVTDKDGNKVTTEVAVQYERDENGRKHAYIIDENGEKVSELPVPEDEQDDGKNTTKKKEDKTSKHRDDEDNSSGVHPSGVDPTTPDPEPTSSKQYPDPPKTSESGTPVDFSDADQNIITDMLEVPYLFEESYENSQGVPIKIATHAAIWMAGKEKLSTSTYASATIVLGLFKYFGQTVVFFKAKCNAAGNPHIRYNESDSFTISDMETERVQSVKIERIERFGDSEYYKVVGSVSGAGSIKKVTAIMQRNRLDRNLGFSVKALKWE